MLCGGEGTKMVVLIKAPAELWEALGIIGQTTPLNTHAGKYIFAGPYR